MRGGVLSPKWGLEPLVIKPFSRSQEMWLPAVLSHLNYRSITRKDIKYQIKSIFSTKVAIIVSHALPPPFSDDPNLVNTGVLHIFSGHIGAANNDGGV